MKFQFQQFVAAGAKMYVSIKLRAEKEVKKTTEDYQEGFNIILTP